MLLAKKKTAPKVVKQSPEDAIYVEYVQGRVINDIAAERGIETQEVINIINKKEQGRK